MASVCFYFQVHQPQRLRHYTVFDHDNNYFDDQKNAEICRKVANKCYLPANRLMLELIEKYKGRFKISYSITGVLLEQLEMYAPEVITTFKQLAATGCVETFLSRSSSKAWWSGNVDYGWSMLLPMSSGSDSQSEGGDQGAQS